MLLIDLILWVYLLSIPAIFMKFWFDHIQEPCTYNIKAEIIN